MIKVSNEITDIVPNFNIGIINLNCKVTKDDKIDEEIIKLEDEINNNYDITDVIKIPYILDARNAYKAFGKDPSRYRLACESLYRRLSKGKHLYRINNVVDLGNILSVKTQKSVAVLDYDNIEGDILIRLGKSSDDYYGIGRGKINIDSIPVYEDDIGPFGSTTSDTERTMITEDTSNILIFIISFSGRDVLNKDIELCKELYLKYTDALINSSVIIP